MRKTILFLVGIGLLPVCWIVTATLVSLVFSIKTESEAIIPPAVWALGGGFLVWVVLYLTVPRPIRTYVLAHELTHAFWAALMGARVSGLTVGKDGGSVRVSKSNVLIVLAPYFFPLYTFLVVVAFYLATVFLDMAPYHLVWLALVGFTWGFHVTFTVSMLCAQQSDVLLYGHLFSYGMIYALNVLGVVIWTVMVSPVTLEQMMDTLGVVTLDTCAAAARLAGQAWRFVASAGAAQ